MENQLAVIVKDAGLEPSKAKYILENFQAYFALAEEWENKARSIVVTSPDQIDKMTIARDGRLFLRDKRIDIEKARKKLKEESLREGKAIDGIANVLKALIVPIEEHLDRQEHFVELDAKKKEDAHRAEVEKRMAEEEAARQKAESEKAEKLRIENEKLRKQNEAAKAKLEAERTKAREAQEKADAEKAAVEAKARAEKEKSEVAKRAAEEKTRREFEAIKAKAEEDRRVAAEASRKKLEAERAEKARLEALLKAQVCCPKCGHKFVPEKK